MTSLHLNAELYRQLSIIADDEGLMTKMLKYAKKLAATKKQDPTLMTKEEFISKIKHSEEQIANGEGMEMLPNEDLTSFLKRNGYDL